MERIDDVLKFWFGRVEETIVPTESRARLWFGETPEIDCEIKTQFQDDFQKAISKEYAEWERTPRGKLALIIILDQFSRHIFRDQSQAFEQDEYAVSICTQGIQQQNDHQLSLIERVFFYFPLLHSEHLLHHEKSLAAYRSLIDLAFPETRVIYESFFKFASHHHQLIAKFGRFPQRNLILGRPSTDEETNYLNEIR